MHELTQNKYYNAFKQWYKYAKLSYYQYIYIYIYIYEKTEKVSLYQ